MKTLIRLTLAAVLAVAFWAACSGGEEDANPERTCEDVFASGRPTADVLADIEAGPCDDDGRALIVVHNWWECPSGAVVHTTDHGWGVEGGVWQPSTVPTPNASCDDLAGIDPSDGAS